MKNCEHDYYADWTLEEVEKLLALSPYNLDLDDKKAWPKGLRREYKRLRKDSPGWVDSVIEWSDWPRELVYEAIKPKLLAGMAYAMCVSAALEQHSDRGGASWRLARRASDMYWLLVSDVVSACVRTAPVIVARWPASAEAFIAEALASTKAVEPDDDEL